MKKLKKVFSLTLGLVMFCSVLAFAPQSGVATPATAAAAPAKITLNVFAYGLTNVSQPRNEQWLWQEYEKKTGIHINWTEELPANIPTKLATIFASGDLPDMFYQMAPGWVTPDMLFQYGSQGYFIQLDKYMSQLPNLTALLQSYPSTKAAMTCPDGHMYGFPYVQTDPIAYSLRYYVNKDMLNRRTYPCRLL